MPEDIVALGKAALPDDERMRKRLYAREAWQTGWQARVQYDAQLHGFSSITELLASRPGVPYEDVVSLFQTPVAPIQIVRLQLEEAGWEGGIRPAAMDVLPRVINRAFPEGWQNGENPDFRRASAFSAFMTGIVFDAKATKEMETKAQQVCDELVKIVPPVGWRPSGPNDPLIQQAFSRAWP
jgi:hypothetical protein